MKIIWWWCSYGIGCSCSLDSTPGLGTPHAPSEAKKKNFFSKLKTFVWDFGNTLLQKQRFEHQRTQQFLCNAQQCLKLTNRNFK